MLVGLPTAGEAALGIARVPWPSSLAYAALAAAAPAAAALSALRLPGIASLLLVVRSITNLCADAVVIAAPPHDQVGAPCLPGSLDKSPIVTAIALARLLTVAADVAVGLAAAAAWRQQSARALAWLRRLRVSLLRLLFRAWASVLGLWRRVLPRRLALTAMQPRGDRSDRRRPLVNDSGCSLCGLPPTMPHHAQCGHAFCYVCVHAELLRHPQARCPACAARIVAVAPAVEVAATVSE